MILSKVAKKKGILLFQDSTTSFAPFLYCFPIQNKSESIANSSVILQHCGFRFEKKISYLKSKLLNKIIRKRKSGYYVYEFRIVYRKETLLDTKWFFSDQNPERGRRRGNQRNLASAALACVLLLWLCELWWWWFCMDMYLHREM